MNVETCGLLNSELEGYEISFKCLIVYAWPVIISQRKYHASSFTEDTA